MATKNLTPEQVEAAKMVGHGAQFADVAREVGVTAATVGRWNRELEEFREAADEARQEDMLSEPEAVAALRDGCGLRMPRKPHHKTRVVAAKALLSRRGVGGAVKASKVRTTTIYVNPDEEDGDDGQTNGERS